MNDLTLKIADFGTSRFISNNTLATTAAVGTISYMAPELYTQEAYDHKADVWSVGLITYQGLFGRLPEILVNCLVIQIYFQI
jgi:serine/threonine protein kinase